MEFKDAKMVHTSTYLLKFLHCHLLALLFLGSVSADSSSVLSHKLCLLFHLHKVSQTLPILLSNILLLSILMMPGVTASDSLSPCAIQNPLLFSQVPSPPQSFLVNIAATHNNSYHPTTIRSQPFPPY